MKARLIVLSGAIALAIAFPSRLSAAIQLTDHSGNVQVREAGQSIWTQVNDTPYDIKPGDSVRTGSGSKVSVTFEDGSRIDISANGSFTLEEGTPQRTGLRLFLGTMRAKVEKLLSRRFVVRTPTAVCSVRGTEFQVSVFSGGRTAVDLYKGLLAVEDQRGQQILLKGGQRLEVDIRGIGKPVGIPSQAQKRAGRFHGVMRREMSLDMSKEDVQAAAAREIKLAEFQQGKALTDVFGRRVRLEEYIVRPQPNQFKLVVLNERKDRFDYFYYQGTFNQDLPRDLSTALRMLPGSVDSAPAYFLTEFETGRSNTIDSMVEIGRDGHPIDVNSNADAGDDVSRFYNSATETFEDVSGRAVYQTLFDDYGFYINGKLKYGWTGANIQTYDDAVASTVNDPLTGAALPGALPNRTLNVTWPDANNLHQVIYESYSDGTVTQWDNYIINDAGRIATIEDFQGATAGAAFQDRLLRFNYQQVITSSEFNGRSIDLVVEPKILIQSGLIQ